MNIGNFCSCLPALCITLFVSACGGGSSITVPTDPDVKRASAARATAESSTNFCATIRPFYWEIGDRNAVKVSGSLNSADSNTQYFANSQLSIASASKWLYGAYVAQRKEGILSADDIKYLTFTSGYTSFSTCLQGQTIAECVAFARNGEYSMENDGKFYYGGGHMEKHAEHLGLGSLTNDKLADELRSKLGNDIGLSYTQPQLAGGGATSAAEYAKFLRKILSGNLAISGLLGSNQVCTNPETCQDKSAVLSPLPATESWHYSIGHWVENDPLVGDGAFSSPGAFGFYPWIDASRTYYGIVARAVLIGYYESVQCGRLIRKAWLTAEPQ